VKAAEINREFIEDRSIEKTSDDSFRHKDVVEELADLALRGPAPSNIALFAPWGTGKSGIAKLLKPKIIDAKQRFVYFDAFKHRDTPLRRSFLRAAVTELDPGKLEDIDTSLYGEQVTQTLNRSDRRKLLWIILGGVLGALVLTAAVSLVLSDIRPGPFDVDFPGLFAKTGGVLALVGALIGAALTTLINGYSVTKTSTPVAEDDEFEQKFQDLVKERGSTRVVVFIDELDRCSADDVVEALETMRIFLETKNCVFVVAVDQQSLEQALRRKARQETPIDEAHPYFSSTGSYIDKIFQYQVALPALRSRDMTVFVGELVKKRPGLWEKLRERDELQDVIGALAPTHVTSPRRVKVLLNSFVMAYHLAEKRVAAEEMSPLDERAAALAKLVCLRTEFPLYADELDKFPSLPQATLAQKRGVPDDKLAQGAPKTWARAKEYLDGELPIAPLLFRPATVRGVDGSSAADQEEMKQAEENVTQQHLSNLLGYLERVDSLPPITRDLVFLHSAAGSGTKLEPKMADGIEEAARDGSEEQLKELLQESSGSEDEVIRLLTSMLAAAEPASLDAGNATHILLAAIELVPELPLTRIEDAADEIVRQQGSRSIDDRDLSAAIGLCGRCAGKRATSLINLIAASDDLLATPPARTRLISAYPTLPSRGHSLAAQAVVGSILGEHDEALEALVQLDPADQETLLREARPILKRYFDAEVSAVESAQDDASEGTEAEPPKPESTVSARWTSPIEHAFDQLSTVAPRAAAALSIAVLLLNQRPLSDLVGARLGMIAPIADTELTRLALRKSKARQLADRGEWLRPLTPEGVDDEAAKRLSDVIAQTWKDVVDSGAAHDEVVELLLAEFKRLAPEAMPTAAVDGAIENSLSGEAVDNPDSEQLATAAALSKPLTDAGLAEAGKTASALVEALAGAISVVPGGDPAGRPNLTSAFLAIKPQIGLADEQALSLLFEKARAAPSDTIGQLRAEVMVAAASSQRGRELAFDGEVALESVLEQVGIDRDSALGTAIAAVRVIVQSGAQLWSILEPYWADGVPQPLREATADAVQDLSDDDHQALAVLVFDHVLTHGPPNPANWEAIDLRGLSARWVITELAARTGAEEFGESSWRAVLEICKQLTTGVAEAQRQIGEELLLPLARSGDSGFRLAVDHLGLVGKGKTGGSIVEAFSELADTEERKALLRRQLDEEHWTKSLARGVAKAIFGAGKSQPKKDDTPPPSESNPSQPDSPGPESERAPDTDEPEGSGEQG
jgi:hypothetical protein